MSVCIYCCILLLLQFHKLCFSLSIQEHFIEHCGKGFRMSHSAPTSSILVNSSLECASICAKDDRCFAYNVVKLSQSQLQCEMFNHIKQSCTPDSQSNSWKKKVRFLSLSLLGVIFSEKLSINCKSRDS